MITYNLIKTYNASDRKRCCTDYTSLINVCDEVTAIVAVMITHHLIEVLDGSEYLHRM